MTASLEPSAAHRFLRLLQMMESDLVDPEARLAASQNVTAILKLRKEGLCLEQAFAKLEADAAHPPAEPEVR